MECRNGNSLDKKREYAPSTKLSLAFWKLTCFLFLYFNQFVDAC